MTHDALTIAKKVLTIESNAISDLINQLDDNFEKAVDALLNCQGRVVVTGMGKSGHIGNKIAATLASTGTPAFFVHPGEASHGDLGMITKQDVVIALSNSGETTEIVSLLPMLKRFGMPLISITANVNSTLATKADIFLSAKIEQEACPLGLAPTSSTTACLALGDALAIAVLESRGFTKEDFAKSHPGGALGKRLLVTVEDLMHTGDSLPLMKAEDRIMDAMVTMSLKGFGITGITDEAGILLSAFTDGDIRRVLESDIEIKTAILKEVMHPNCKTIEKTQLAAKALQQMEQCKITSLFIVDDNQRPIGLLHMHDLLKAGIA